MLVKKLSFYKSGMPILTLISFLSFLTCCSHTHTHTPHLPSHFCRNASYVVVSMSLVFQQNQLGVFNHLKKSNFLKKTIHLKLSQTTCGICTFKVQGSNGPCLQQFMKMEALSVVHRGAWWLGWDLKRFDSIQWYPT